jgi:ribosome maturation factor RimP
LAHSLIPSLESLAEVVADPLGFRLHSLALHSHRSPQALVVCLQRGDGSDVSLDDCAAYSSALAEALDQQELISSAYVLEISSPGVGDILKQDRDFRSFRGFPVTLLRLRDDGRQIPLKGSLLGRDDDVVEINQRGRVMRIPRPEVLEVRLSTPSR